MAAPATKGGKAPVGYIKLEVPAVTALYPVMLVIMNGAMWVMLLIRRKILERS